MVSVAYSDFLGKEGLIHRFYALVEVTHYPTNWGVSVKMNSSIAKEHNAVRLPRRKGAEQRLLIRYKKLLICYKNGTDKDLLCWNRIFSTVGDRASLIHHE